MMAEQTWINPEVDRSTWGPGPWDGEPDKVSWADEATGLPCIALRANPELGNWCGYVAVEPGHPLHGHGYDDADLEVHGGLTFASSCMQDRPVEASVCHVPEPGKPADVFWFGFDCGHAWDVAPAMDARERAHGWTPVHDKFPHATPPTTYKTLGFVKAECAQLASQLKALE
jgi:hypothetical protein